MKSLVILMMVGWGLALGGCAATAKPDGKTSVASVSCVVCAKRMAHAAVTRSWNGKTLCYCSLECEKRFVKNPEQFPH